MRAWGHAGAGEDGQGMAGYEASEARAIRLRLGICGVVFFLLLAIVMVRAVHLQVVQADHLGEMARDQYLRDLALQPRRGPILDARGVPLAISVETDSVFVEPKNIVTEPGAEGALDAKALAKALSLETALVKKRAGGKGSFAWLKRRITPAESHAVSKLKAKGVGFVKEYRRFYPQKQLAAHVLGMVNLDSDGVEGLEKVHDAALRGSQLEYQAVRDSKGALLPSEAGVPGGAILGATVQLTLDATIQQAAEEALAAGIQSSKAKAGMVVVLDPQTGAVLALANAPSFNPNGSAGPDERRDRAVTDAYEPGSVIKCFTFAGALADGVLKPQQWFTVGDGAWTIGRKTIRDSHPPEKSVLSATEVLATSSNVGTLQIGLSLGKERLVNWMKAFGFGERTQVGLTGEARGQLQDPQRMGEIATATTSFGQGMSATPMQVTAALVAIANGGELLRPYLVQKVTEADGTVLVERRREVVRRVVRPEVARVLTQMMVAVTEKGGTGTRAAIPGIRVAGKTGTAQKVDPGGKGYGKEKFVSFMGFAPAEDPKVAIFVGIDEPGSEFTGGLAAGPVFKTVAMEALRQRGVSFGPAGTALEVAVAKQKGKERDDDTLEGFIDEDAALATALLASTELAAGGSSIVPDLKGLSARAALRLLGERALEAELQGSGRAIAQKPEAGKSVPPGTRVRVVLEAG